MSLSVPFVNPRTNPADDEGFVTFMIHRDKPNYDDVSFFVALAASGQIVVRRFWSTPLLDQWGRVYVEWKPL